MSEKMYNTIAAFGVNGAIKEFVNSDKDYDRIVLEPYLLNPFLKCLENMEAKASIELSYNKNTNKPFYIVKKLD